MTVYPILFEPVFKERLWGGRKLESVYHKALPSGVAIGESWEFSDMPGDESVAANGPLKGKALRAILDSLGIAYGFTAEQCRRPFGLFIKFLDAQQVLSVQVHPDHGAVSRWPGAALKTECWYVLYAEPGATIYYGLKPGVTSVMMKEAVSKGTVDALLEAVNVKKSDFFFVPAGTVHALGAGVMVAEIQTPSDTTYRLFDWNRVDDTGKPRPLHIDQAMASIHFEAERPPIVLSNADRAIRDSFQAMSASFGDAQPLVSCPYFHVQRISTACGTRRMISTPRPCVLISLSSRGMIRLADSDADRVGFFREGQTLLVPKHDGLVMEIEQAGELLLACLGSEKA